MATALHHTHLLSVILFLLIYLIKTGLLLSNKTENLAKFSKMIKVPEMIISTLFLATGIYMVYQLGATTLLMIKIAMVIASIPLAIIGFKKGNKVLAVISLLLIIGAYGLAEVNKKRIAKKDIDPAIGNTSTSTYDTIAHGQNLYVAYCTNCHGTAGEGGSMGVSLINSTFDATQKADRIKNGSGTMPAFKDALTEEEVTALVSFVETLK
jgi:uncharacterized membrane protein SirB2